MVNYKPSDLDRVFATRSQHGRTVEVRLSPVPLRVAAEWLRHYERFWAPALDRLAAHAERKEAEAQAAEAKAKGKVR